MCVFTGENARLSLSIIKKSIYSWTLDPGDIWLLVRWSYSDRWFWCERIATIAFPIWRAEPRPNLVSAGCRRFSIRTRPVLSTFDYLEISPQYTGLSLLDIFGIFEIKKIYTTNCMQQDSLWRNHSRHWWWDDWRLCPHIPSIWKGRSLCALPNLFTL